ncbi:MAG: hypothetical protein B6244_14670, partial [Candidatus Cloacimonetes bacterium 4572_55]
MLSFKFLKALMLILFFCCTVAPADAQNDYDPDISWMYDHQDPENPETNQGDWRSMNYILYLMGDSNEPTSDAGPFYTHEPARLTDIALDDDSDFQPEDGWELLLVRLGTVNDPVANPSLILYNRYTGVLRTFIYKTSDITYTGIHLRLIKLSSQPTAFLAMVAGDGNGLRAADKRTEESDNQFCRIFTDEFAAGNGWFYADFQAMYDPIADQPDYIENEFTVGFKGYRNSTITMEINWAEGHTTTSGENNNPSFDPAAFGQKLYKTAKDGSKWADDFEDTTWYLDYNEGWIEPITGAIEDARLGIAESKILGLLPYANVVFGVFDFFSGGGGQRSFISQLAQLLGDIVIEGEIYTEFQDGSYSFFEPTTNSGRAIQPLYDKTLGTFNLATTPELECVIQEEYGGVYEEILTISYRVIDNLDWVINPNCGLQTTPRDLEIAIIFKVSGGVSAPDIYGYRRVLGSGGSVWQTRFIDYEHFQNTALLLPGNSHLIKVAFKVKAVLEVENNPELEPILFMADYKVETRGYSGDLVCFPPTAYQNTRNVIGHVDMIGVDAREVHVVFTNVSNPEYEFTMSPYSTGDYSGVIPVGTYNIVYQLNGTTFETINNFLVDDSNLVPNRDYIQVDPVRYISSSATFDSYTVPPSQILTIESGADITITEALNVEGTLIVESGVTMSFSNSAQFNISGSAVFGDGSTIIFGDYGRFHVANGAEVSVGENSAISFGDNGQFNVAEGGEV